MGERSRGKVHGTGIGGVIWRNRKARSVPIGRLTKVEKPPRREKWRACGTYPEDRFARLHIWRSNRVRGNDTGF